MDGTCRRKWLPQSSEELISPFPSLLDIARSQGHADAFRGVVGVVRRVMTPPTSVVVPEVMVRIGRIDPDRQCFIFHMRFPVVQTHQGVDTPEDKKGRLLHQEAACRP